MRTKLSIPLILFTLLSLISIYSIYYTHQLPTEEETTTTLCSYWHTGKYDYTAKLKPNLLYNQPTLKPGQGTLYTKIIDHINITFTYTFTCSQPTNTSIGCQTNTELESPEKWTKTFTTAEMLDILQIANTVNTTQQKATTTLSLNTTKIDELVRTIDGQIGTTTSQYNLLVKPNIYIVADITLPEADVRTIYESFAPSLTIEFGKGTPSYISIENLEHTRPATITGTHQTFLQWVVNWRLASLLATAVNIPLLAVTTWFYLTTKLPPSPKPIEKIIAPHKELIAETTQRPPETTTTITMASIEDLAKISEALIKPILHTTEPTTKEQTTHTFYIIENHIKYQYKTTTPTRT